MKTKLLLLLTALSFLIYTCKKSDGKTGSPNGPTPPALSTNSSPITATIQGNVFNENGQPVSGVSISVGAKTTTTDFNGYFRVDNASLDKNASLLTGHMDGYFRIVKLFAATSGENYIRIKMIKRNLAGTVNASIGGTVSLPDGTSIALPSNAVVKKSDNSSYTGTVNVYVATIDPSSQDFPETVPGNLVGNDSAGKRVGLRLFGLSAVELESAAADPLQIAPGKTASLSFNIPSSLQSKAPASIPLWYLNDTTGLWQQQGSAVKSGSTYTGTVSHFSFWSDDVPFFSVILTITFTDANNRPLQYAIVVLKSADYGMSYGFTDSLGLVSCLVPYNEKLDYAVFSNWFCANNFAPGPIGPFLQSSTVSIVVDTNTVATTLSGTLTNCANNPAANGYVEIYHNYVKYVVPVDQGGNFSLSLPRCGSNDSISLFGVDTSGKQQSVTAYYVLNSPSKNIGNISACGQAIDVYANVVYDGIAYSLIDTMNTHNNIGNLYGGTDIGFEFERYSTSTTIASNVRALYFNIHDFGITGTFQLQGITFIGDNTNAVSGAEPFNIYVNLTEYAHSIGEYYAGNFTGSYTDTDFHNPLTHTINCSFRVRRNN